MAERANFILDRLISVCWRLLDLPVYALVILAALVLGLLGALSPRQLSTNAGAVAFVSRRAGGLTNTAALALA